MTVYIYIYTDLCFLHRWILIYLSCSLSPSLSLYLMICFIYRYDVRTGGQLVKSRKRRQATGKSVLFCFPLHHSFHFLVGYSVVGYCAKVQQVVKGTCHNFTRGLRVWLKQSSCRVHKALTYSWLTALAFVTWLNLYVSERVNWWSLINTCCGGLTYPFGFKAWSRHFSEMFSFTF